MAGVVPTSGGDSRRELREGLVAEEEEETVPASFYKDEVKTMCSVGWPMLVSFFCRYGMAAEDTFFVGHLTTTAASHSQRLLSSRIWGQVGATLISYGFLTNADPSAGYGPKEYLAAAQLADMVTNILIIPPLAFNMCLNALVSQAMGSGNKKMAGTWCQMSLIWLTLSYLPCLVSFFFVSPMLGLLGFDADICELAGTYAKVNAIWPIPNGWYQCMRFYFQAQGVTRPAMYNNMLFLAVNALLNWIFVFGGPFRAWFGWHGFGFVGAAISLSCSRSLQPLFYWLYMYWWKKAHVETWPRWSERTWQKREHVRAFMKMALPNIGTLIFQAVIGQATTLLIAKLGTMAISASSAVSAATIVLSGSLSPTLSMVGGMRVGYYLGKGQPMRANRVSTLAMGLGCGLTGILSLAALPFANQIMKVVTSDPAIQSPAAAILPAVMLNMAAAIVVSIGTQGVLQSQGRTGMVTFLSMGFELPMTIGSTAILVFVFNASLQTVYWAQAAVTIIEAVVVVAIVQRSDWAGCARDAQQRQGQQGEENEEDACAASPNASEASTTTGEPAAAGKGGADGASAPAAARGA